MPRHAYAFAALLLLLGAGSAFARTGPNPGGRILIDPQGPGAAVRLPDSDGHLARLAGAASRRATPAAVQAVNAPRVHHQHLPDQINYERSGLDPATVERLEAMGHSLVERSGVSGDVQMILVEEDGTLTAWSDPRRGGRAVGY